MLEESPLFCFLKTIKFVFHAQQKKTNTFFVPKYISEAVLYYF